IRHQNKLRIRREEEYRKTTDEEMMQDKMNFFSHVVHEIKTPLTLIRTPLQSVIAKDTMDDETRHDLKVMQSNTDYLTRLVNELLEFVRIERSGYVLNCEAIELVDTINSLIFNYSETAAVHNLKIVTDALENRIWVSADRSALGKILNNILINALKYADSLIRIRIGRDSGGSAIVDISNDGDLIPPEAREEIFKPFVQCHQSPSRASSGVGIGLSLAKSLARMHSGDLELLDSGDLTTFRLTIPTIVEPADESGDESQDGGTDNSKPLLLLVDDYNDLREFMTRKLSCQYNVLSVSEAQAAIRALRENNVDLMITDITMPGTDGLQLCRFIRSDVELSHLPIIILSARTSVESKIEAMSSGADLYIEKPFDMEYLKSSIRNILERRALMRKALNSGAGDVDITVFGLPKRDEEFFRMFDKLVSDNISDSELSNEFLAGQLCISVSTMIRKIRKLLNTSPNNYIRNKRLSLAAKMIRDSHGNNITEICYSVGFTNVSYFAKCFKEQYGVTPSEWAAS
ncbi:MAG: response regulator, partial [Candidatus Cryptobacteroides sp.]